MRVTRTMTGFEARLTPRGYGRWGDAAFLGVWLLFWVVGEVMVAWLLVAGGIALLTGQPPKPGQAPLETVPALATGVFLTVWLAFWTLGGVFAGREFFRLTWSADRLAVRSDGIALTRRIGPWVRRRWLPREALRGLHRGGRPPAVQAEMADGVIELTSYGTPDEQAQLLAALRETLRPAPADRLAPVLPAEWRVIAAPEGGEVLVRNPAARRAGAWVAGVVGTVLGVVAATALAATPEKPAYGAVAAILAALAGFSAWGARRLARERDEWRLEKGRVVRQRRRGTRAEERGTGIGLRLSEGTDSDGDRVYRLDLQLADGGVQLLGQTTQEPIELRQLAAWLAARTGVAWADDATPEKEAAAAAQREEAKAKLKQAVREWVRGWFGRGKG